MDTLPADLRSGEEENRWRAGAALSPNIPHRGPAIDTTTLIPFDGGKSSPRRNSREYDANSPENARYRKNAIFMGRPVALTCWAVLSHEDMHLLGFFTTRSETEQWKNEIIIELNGEWKGPGNA